MRLAIIIVGPSRAAEIAGEIGRLVARARRTINSMTEDLQTQAREETEPLRSARESIRDVESKLRRPLDLPDAVQIPGRLSLHRRKQLLLERVNSLRARPSQRTAGDNA